MSVLDRESQPEIVVDINHGRFHGADEHDVTKVEFNQLIVVRSTKQHRFVDILASNLNER